MKKFLAGLVLGLAIGATYFHYQVKKVDFYSSRIGYLLGVFDATSGLADSQTLHETLEGGCAAYWDKKLDVAPFGYKVVARDVQLKEVCQKFRNEQ